MVLTKTAQTLAGMSLLATALLTSACAGGDEPAGTPVASVAAPAGAEGTTSSSTSKAVTAKLDRQLKLGFTPQEEQRLLDAYYACWAQEGVPDTKMPNGESGGRLLTYKMDPERWQKAVDACSDSEPLYPPETDPQTNPGYWDQLRTQLACMTGKGYAMEIREGSQGLWVAPATKANLAKAESPQGTADLNACEAQAFGDKG
ncbi:hypothetical protein Kisp01_37000 [Kineosporia sp. NBRC 101677]|nr:hypothetical protein Kisp01_37000 [Kineosporia sp. NBRC 101677]